ncbi:MAG: tripartite tricarboxylate transporter substrate-binding protein, partial [Phycisphaerae bacterium]
MLPVAAQTFPAKPVRLIIPFSAGGAADVPGRIITQRLADQFMQQVLVDNRPGGGGIMGGQLVSRAAPDGYTMSL